MIKSVKRLGAAVLSAVMMLTAVATPLGDNLPAVRESTSLTAGATTVTVTQKEIVDYVKSRVGGSYRKNYCLAFVADCFAHFGATFSSACCAKGYSDKFMKSTDKNIPLGADVFFSGGSVKCGNGHICGHIGIYVGNNKIVHASGGTIKETDMKYMNMKYEGWGWHGNIIVSDNLNLTDHYKLTSPDGYQTIRKEASTSSANLGSINTGSVVCVTKYSSDNKWGYLTYNGISGWIRLYYVEKAGSSHSYGSWYTTTSATCTSGGTEERKCSCGATESRSTSALGHNYGSWSTVTNATCTSGGSEKRTCSRCSNSETRSTSALGHNYGSTYFEAVHPHKYAHLCQRCGYKEFTGGNLDYYYLCATCTHLTKPEVTKITGDLVDNSEITIEWTASESDKLANYWLDVFDPDGQNVVDVSTGKINSYTFTPVKTGTYTIKTFAAPIGNKDGSGSVGAETTIEIGCNHNYITEIVNPTYDNEGYTLHKCTKCGYSYKDNYTPALKLTELTGVKVKTQGTASLTLAWDKNASAKGYIIEQYKGGKWTQVAKTSSNTAVTYTVNGLAADTTYTFRIKAYVISGESEIYGGYVKIAGKTRIPNVASFKGRAVSQTAVKLDWSKNDKATGYVIEQYKGGKWTALATTKNNTTLTFTVKGLAKGTTYSFRIKSFRKTGSTTDFSEYTAIKAATLLDSVSDFKVASTTGSWITLEWAKNDKATGYAIEQYKGGKWTVIATTKNNTTLKFTVKGLKNDTTYSFRIRAYKTAGASNVYSDYVRIAGKTRIPNVATFTGSAVSASAVKLDWSKNDKATGYVIEQYKGGKWTALATTKNNTTLTFTVKGLAKGTTYSFRIKSFRKTGSTTDFSEYTAIKAATLLDGVSDLKVTSVTGSWITLEWAKNDKATGYAIEQYKGGKWTVIATTKNNTTLKFTVKGLKNDTTYSFRIRAYKTAGGVTAYSDYVRIAGKTRIPNVATFKGSAASASAVKLDWSKNDKATAYVIEQYKGGKWTVLATTKNNTTLTFTVKGLAKGTTYSFRIKSFRKTGSTTEFSEYASVKVNTAE